MKGYRTVAFNLVMGGLAIVGAHVAPDTVGHWLDAIFAGIVVVNIVLRALTDTPMFNKVAKDVGLTLQQADDIARAVHAAVPEIPDSSAAVADLAQKVDALAGHPLFNPELAGQLAAIVQAQLVTATAGAKAAAAPPAPPSPVSPGGAS